MTDAPQHQPNPEEPPQTEASQDAAPSAGGALPSVATPPTSPPPAADWSRAWWRELIIAAKYITRLRIPLSGLPERGHIAGALTWFPLIGALVGAFGGIIDGVGIGLLHLPPTITSGLAVLAMMWLTRGLHEEQIAAFANQYSDLNERQHRVGWLNEERSVRYGTIAMIFVIVLRVNALGSLDSVEVVLATLIASGAWSHALMSVAAAWLRPLPSDPVADHFGQPTPLRVFIALVLGATVVLAVMSAGAALALLVSSVVAACVIVCGLKLFGGYNGPLLGTVQQLADLAVICALVAAQSFGD
jgi:adenosylcobinamide-GDP ribazoletransferase